MQLFCSLRYSLYLLCNTFLQTLNRQFLYLILETKKYGFRSLAFLDEYDCMGRTQKSGRKTQVVTSHRVKKKELLLTSALLANSVLVRPAAASELGAITTWPENRHRQRKLLASYFFPTLATNLLLVLSISFSCPFLSRLHFLLSSPPVSAALSVTEQESHPTCCHQTTGPSRKEKRRKGVG